MLNNTSCLDKRKIKTILKKYDFSKQKLISILHEIQKLSTENYISEQHATIISQELNIPLSEIYDIMTFYDMFEHRPRGKYVIEVCNSAPCHVRNSKKMISTLEKLLSIKMGETTEDKLFTLKYTSCIGACNISPAIKIGENVYGNLTEERLKIIISKYKEGHYE
ncbi:NAD(P)H-dependent oxidoreductase subunit E [Haloimpatiens sp. FM7330]|uniref:NADH-quinone oxidoreductase subunit NuoE family protein n=1 Tax=Haloimpatiens sp. FM7330 TaxID=3298610 RepID=UPI0036410C8B